MRLAELLKKYAGDLGSIDQPSTNARATGRIQLPECVDEWPEDLFERYHERAAIMEFEGGLPRDQAEKEAERITKERAENSLIRIAPENQDV